MKSSLNSIKNSIKKILAGVFFFTIITNCSGNTDYQTIHDAELCLDKATASTAQLCINMVAGMSSPAASMIRCAGVFTAEGKLTPAGITTLLNSLQGGGNATTNAISGLAFASQANANIAVTECAASGSAGLAMLGSMASIATTAALVLGGGSGCGTVNQSCLTTNATAIANTAGVAAAVTSAYTQNCASTSASNPYNSFCTQYAAAAAANPGGSAATITAYLLANIK